jgi:thioredoxin-related protein
MKVKTLCVAMLLLAGCGAREQSAPVAAKADGVAAATAVSDDARQRVEPDRVAWFDGSVDAAFEAARAQHKPVFLYWGAVWCPPCHQLKATVFSRDDFVAKTKLFIPVYLDGDNAGAQKWAETFHVTGYPTLVVLNEKREEVMRIAGGMDLTQYANVLDIALADLQPVSGVMAALSHGRALTDSECRRLAYNAWGLEENAGNSALIADQLSSAAAHCPAAQRNEIARLGIFAAAYRADAEAAAIKAGKPISGKLRLDMRQLHDLLADVPMSAANSDALRYLDDSFWKAVKQQKEIPASEYYARFAKVMDVVAGGAAFTEPDRLAAIGGKLQATKTLQGSVDPQAAAAATARIDAALAREKSPYVRSALINSALWIYDTLGQADKAYAVVNAEIPKSQTAYYLKADLAAIAEELDRKEEALQLSSEAYAESRGTATRFQWGRLYLDALLRLKPTDTALIQQVGTQVLGELDGENRIYQRARQRLVTLDGELRKWQKESKGKPDPARTAVLHALRERMQQTCGGISATDAARKSCDAFLSGVV